MITTAAFLLATAYETGNGIEHDYDALGVLFVLALFMAFDYLCFTVIA